MKAFIFLYLLLLSGISCSQYNASNNDKILLLSKSGINNLKFGSSIEDVSTFFKVEDIVRMEDGYKLISKKKDFDDGSWIIFEANNGFGKIDLIKTNSSYVVTSDSIKVGMSIKELIDMGLDLQVFSDIGELKLISKKGGSIFKVDKKSESNFFKNGGDFPQTLDMDARIIELEMISPKSN